MSDRTLPAQPHVLAIHAHPDDIEFQCAGTLLQLKRLGCRISVATMTPGDCGSADTRPKTSPEFAEQKPQQPQNS